MTEDGRNWTGTKQALHRFTINRTQPAIISQRAMAFERPEQIRFEVKESEEPPERFLKPGASQELRVALEDPELAQDLAPLLEGFTEG